MRYLFVLIPVVFLLTLSVDYARQTQQGDPRWWPTAMNAAVVSLAVAALSLLLLVGFRGLTAA